MPTRPLYKAAVTACIKNIRGLTDVSDVPYEVVRPILVKMDNPEQLRQIEEASPQICGLDGELWLELIKRDIPNWDTKPHTPKNPKSWYKVYQKLRAETEREVDEDAARVKAEMDRIKQERAKNTIKPVELNVYNVPEGLKRQGPTLVMTRKPQFQDKVYRPPPELRIRDSDSDPDELSRSLPGPSDHSTRPSRAARPNNAAQRANSAPKSKLDKIRKEVKAVGHFQHHNQNKVPQIKLKPVSMNKVMSTNKIIPTNKTIIKAPHRLIEEHRKPAVPQPIDLSIKPASVFVPKRTRIEPERPTIGKESRNPSSNSRSTLVSNHPGPCTTTYLTHADEPLHSTEIVAALAAPKPAARETTSSTFKRSVHDASNLSQETQKTTASTPTKGAIRVSCRESPYVQPRANTSSPGRSAVPPPMQIKRKQPVDIFMRPAKHQRAA